MKSSHFYSCVKVQNHNEKTEITMKRPKSQWKSPIYPEGHEFDRLNVRIGYLKIWNNQQSKIRNKKQSKIENQYLKILNSALYILPSLVYHYSQMNNNPEHVEEKSRLWKITERDSCVLKESFLEAIEN